MNKDLKTIDDALNSGVLNTNDFFEFDSATVEIIYGAAERMAAYIEHQKKIISNLGAEITRLKAELEKRPEVLYCKDCRSIQHEYSQDEDGRIIAELLVCGMSGRPIGELDFCSYGQRRESEEC